MPIDRRLPLRSRPLAAGCLVGAAALVTAGCGSSKPAHTTANLQGATCVAASGGKVTLVAKSSRWDHQCVTLRGTAVTFTIRNDDQGILHNLNVKDAPGTPKTNLEPGPTTQTLALQGLTPGTTYTYVCDLHPNMIGELRVS